MRLLQFDILKLFAIFMVIWGHCIQHLLSSNHIDETGYIIIYSFHMPLFMTISGYFASSSLNRDFITSIMTKSRQLLLPCLSASFVLTCYVLFIEEESVFTVGKFLSKLDGNLRYSFWFLKTAFFCFLMAKISYGFGKFKTIAFIITLLLSNIPFITKISYFTVNIATMYPCFVVGILIKAYWDDIIKHTKSITIGSGIVFLIMLLFWNKDFWQPKFEMLENIKNGDIIRLFYLGYLILYRLIIGIAGSIFFFTLFQLVFGNIKNKATRKICEYGKYTMCIYILQTFILEILMEKYIKFDYVNEYVFNLLIVPAISIALLILCIFLSKILDSNKYTSLLFLGKKMS